MKTLTKHPMAQFSRKLTSKFKEAGYRNLLADFNTLPPIGDFVEDPNIPIPVLVSCEKKFDATASRRKWLKLHAILSVPRKANLKEYFSRDEVWDELLDAFLFCEEHIEEEQLDLIEEAKKTLRDEWSDDTLDQLK